MTPTRRHNVARYVGNSPVNWFDPNGNVSAKEYAASLSRVAGQAAKCLANLGVDAVGDFAAASVYVYLANGQWYVGQTRQEAGKRKKQHEAFKKILIKSFDPFSNSKFVSKRKLDVLERYLFDLLEQELPGETSNRQKPLGDKKYKRWKHLLKGC